MDWPGLLATASHTFTTGDSMDKHGILVRFKLPKDFVFTNDVLQDLISEAQTAGIPDTFIPVPYGELGTFWAPGICDLGTLFCVVDNVIEGIVDFHVSLHEQAFFAFIAPIYVIENKCYKELSEKCGCYQCENIMLASDITDWCDEGETAICPFCGIDAVIFDKTPIPITHEFLHYANERWFNHPGEYAP